MSKVSNLINAAKLNVTEADYEAEYTWHEMTQAQCHLVIASHVALFKEKGLKATHERLERIFNLAQPKCIIGVEKGKPFCRVHQESVSITVKLISEYLNSK